MRSGKPQRRTLVRALSELADRVKGHVLTVDTEKQMKATYKKLLSAMNEADRVLERERRHSKAKEKQENTL